MTASGKIIKHRNDKKTIKVRDCSFANNQRLKDHKEHQAIN